MYMVRSREISATTSPLKFYRSYCCPRHSWVAAGSCARRRGNTAGGCGIRPGVATGSFDSTHGVVFLCFLKSRFGNIRQIFKCAFFVNLRIQRKNFELMQLKYGHVDNLYMWWGECGRLETGQTKNVVIRPLRKCYQESFRKWR